MKISAKDTVAGFPVLQIRDLLKRGDSMSKKSAADNLGISPAKAQTLLDSLTELGFIEPYDVNGRTIYNNTVKGNALAMAKATPSITKEKAEKLFDEFMQRVTEVNGNDYYLYRVSKVILFGSFIQDVPTVNDIDIAFELTAKEKKHDKFLALNKQRVEEAVESGKTFNSFEAEIFYSHKQVVMFLKSRVKYLSFHTTDDLILGQTETRQVFP